MPTWSIIFRFKGTYFYRGSSQCADWAHLDTPSLWLSSSALLPPHPASSFWGGKITFYQGTIWQHGIHDGIMAGRMMMMMMMRWGTAAEMLEDWIAEATGCISLMFLTLIEQTAASVLLLMTNRHLKAPAHQTDNKGQAATNIRCCFVFCSLLSGQKVALFTPWRQQLATNRIVCVAPVPR